MQSAYILKLINITAWYLESCGLSSLNGWEYILGGGISLDVRDPSSRFVVILDTGSLQ